MRFSQCLAEGHFNRPHGYCDNRSVTRQISRHDLTIHYSRQHFEQTNLQLILGNKVYPNVPVYSTGWMKTTQNDT